MPKEGFGLEGLERYGLRRKDAYNQKKRQEQIRAKTVNPGQPG